MPLPVVGRAVDVVARRCSVPRDLTPITVYGDEAGSDEIAERIWERVEALYRTGMHPGIQLCIRHDGQVVVHRAIGHARGNLPGRRFDAETATPMTLDTPVNLFSAAKAVTGMVVHKLEELGTLRLDDRVADHLPDFARHGKDEITIRHVLTHRAGIPSLPEEAMDLDLLADPERVEKLVCELRPVHRPGEKPAYHAVTGGFVVDAIVRRATGRSLREVLAAEIKEPLGLQWFDFGVEPEHAEAVAMNVETGLPLLGPLELMMRRTLGTPWSRVLRMSNDDRYLTGVIPSGNVIVTARDVATFYQCLLDGGTVDGTRVFDSVTVDRAIQAERAGLEIDRMLGMPMRYSSGFMLGAEGVSLYGYNHPRAFGHVGMSNLFTWADPERDLVVALLTTGKPVLGTHLVALPRLIGGIHEEFPVRS